MGPEVEVEYPDGSVGRFPFTGSTLLLGRGQAAHIRVDDVVVSPSHVRFFVRDGKVFVEDLGSVSGTFLRDQPLPAHSPRLLGPGDRLRVGRLQVRLSANGGPTTGANRLVARPGGGLSSTETGPAAAPSPARPATAAPPPRGPSPAATEPSASGAAAAMPLPPSAPRPVAGRSAPQEEVAAGDRLQSVAPTREAPMREAPQRMRPAPGPRSQPPASESGSQEVAGGRSEGSAVVAPRRLPTEGDRPGTSSSEPGPASPPRRTFEASSVQARERTGDGPGESQRDLGHHPDFEQRIVNRRSHAVAEPKVRLGPAWGKAAQAVGALLVVAALTVLVVMLLQ